MGVVGICEMKMEIEEKKRLWLRRMRKSVII